MLIPEGLHRLVGLPAGSVVGSADRLLVVLVEGKDEVELVAGVLIAQFESIMVASGYVPVEPAEDGRNPTVPRLR